MISQKTQFSFSSFLQMQATAYMRSWIAWESRLSQVPRRNQKHGSRLPRVILVLDCSGSMGNRVSEIANNWFPRTLIKEGYDCHTPADVIGFSHEAFVLKRGNNNGNTPTLEDLTEMKTSCLGVTKMGGVFDLLQKMILEDPNSAFLIVAISDGEIQDVRECLAAAERVAPVLRFAQIKVCMIRLKTSLFANPDTRALASIGLIDTSTDSSIHDITADSQMFSHILSEAIQASSKSVHTVSTQTNCLRRFPSDAPAKRLTCGAEGIVFLASDVTSLSCDGNVLRCEQKPFKDCEEAEILQTFCDTVEHHVRFLNVTGLSTKAIVEWFHQLKTLLESSNNAVMRPEPGFQSRLQRILRETRKTERKCINELLMNAGTERVKTLNSAQQADYLRTTQSKKLARRVEKTAAKEDSKESSEESVAYHLQALRAKILTETKEGAKDLGNEERSFYSLFTMREALCELFEWVKNEEELSRMDILSLLKLVGHVGLCYHSFTGDLVDPYTFYVDEIFETPLSCNDLREANSQKSHDGECYVLEAPAHHKHVITGVMPLRFMQEALFDLIPLEIQRAHASINMRKMTHPCPKTI